MEFDHLFICVPPGAGDAETLTAAGFTEGPSNRHPGQGTANRSFFFENSFIELLFEVDDAELRSQRTSPTHLYERLNRTGPDISPFGCCFRPSLACASDQSAGSVPLPGWNYQPEYLPDHLSVRVADTALTEPMWFYLEFGQRPDSLGRVGRGDLQHANRVSAITGVSITVPRQVALSEVACGLSKTHGFSVLCGEEHLAVVEFDHHKENRRCDLRPELPLVLCW